MAVPVLSFFTGGGFLDIGFEQAGFDVVWTNDNNPAFARMYAHGISAWRKSQKKRPWKTNISNTSCVETLKAAAVRREAFGNETPDIFGLIGGPPCPDFSNGGNHAGHNGSNGKLTKTFIDLIGRIKPDFFVIENVAGLFRFRKHRSFLDDQVAFLREEKGYAIDYRLLNSLQLGVPQNRERVFVVGFRKQIATTALGHRPQKDEEWFPWPKVEEYTGSLELAWPDTSEFGDKPRKPTGIPIELTVYPLLFENNPEKVANGREFFNAYSDKFKERAEGDVSGKSFKRLHRFRYSPTVWYGNQEVHLHPSKPRRLSVRECLRIQTVPDEYTLPENESLSAKFKLICNGVPCLMAEHIGDAVASFLQDAGIET